MYDAGDGLLLFRFSDRVSAYDVQFSDTIPRKGEVLCKFAQFWFESLDVYSHFVRRVSDTEILVRRMDMIPMECVVRGYLYGSATERFRKNQLVLPNGTRDVLAARLSRPVFDPTTKAKQDIPINKDEAIRRGLLTAPVYDRLEDTSISLYNTMYDRVGDAGFLLADLKLEFGMLDGKICLGDSIGPDEYRMWRQDQYSEGRSQNAYDKQILRDWLSDNGWVERFKEDRIVGRSPSPPRIPSHIRDSITARYVESYESITGISL